ncbi:hypothetical protein CHS0354_006438 [Potamilus streckersoni]|uniref:Uncharacterized protein n=1 Tax=Potamilus streckersoni TaxID=2493646 RepID=A0AAE0TA90_9BIVA|nr:hypothetical protein CHS0354_006438 [Potamilus streckersoni]
MADDICLRLPFIRLKLQTSDNIHCYDTKGADSFCTIAYNHSSHVLSWKQLGARVRGYTVLFWKRNIYDKKRNSKT